MLTDGNQVVATQAALVTVELKHLPPRNPLEEVRNAEIRAQVAKACTKSTKVKANKYQATAQAREIKRKNDIDGPNPYCTSMLHK
jgi:hypothetical protein